MIEADTPNLWEIRNHTDHATAIGIIVIALIHTARLVNIEANLNEAQIGEIANDVLEDYGYLKVEELKYILKTAVKTQKIFGRLDYNVVMGWFEEYDAIRTEEAMSISDCEAAHENGPSEDAISFEAYAALLRDKAAAGDKEAQGKLESINQMLAMRATMVSKEQAREEKIAFRKFQLDYAQRKKQHGVSDAEP